MKLRFLVASLALGLLTTTAHAQTGLYLNPIAMHVSLSQADTGPYAFLGQNNTSAMFYGISLGGYYDFHSASKMKFGFDVRDAIVHSNNAALDNVLFGLRISGQPFSRPFRPYVQPAIGFGRSTSPSSPLHKTNAEFTLNAGVDYPIRKHIDWRMLELGYSSVGVINSSNFGYPTTFSAAKVFSISTGLVFRIH